MERRQETGKENMVKPDVLIDVGILGDIIVAQLILHFISLSQFSVA